MENQNVLLEQLYLALAPDLCVFTGEKLEDLQRLITNLDEIEPHQAFFLLRNCLSIPRLMYLLRSSPAWQRPEILSQFDVLIREKAESICNINFQGSSWQQASLPVRFGGLGLRECFQISLPCYLSSREASAQLMAHILSEYSGLNPSRESDVALDAWAEVSRELPQVRTSQRAWDEIAIKKSHENLLSQADQQSRARLLAAEHGEAGAWLHALPVSNVGNLLSHDELRIAVALRVGANITVDSRCRCGKTMNALGTHGLSCRLNAGRFPRHSELNRIIHQTLARINIPSRLEPTGLMRGDGKRPDGLTLCPWERGRCLVWDATVVDTFAQSHVLHCAVEAGKAAEAAEVLKAHKYSELSDNYIFQPVAFETSGAAGPDSRLFIKKLGRMLVQSSGDVREHAFLNERISICIARGNAASILSCLER